MSNSNVVCEVCTAVHMNTNLKLKYICIWESNIVLAKLGLEYLLYVSELIYKLGTMSDLQEEKTRGR